MVYLVSYTSGIEIKKHKKSKYCLLCNVNTSLHYCFNVSVNYMLTNVLLQVEVYFENTQRGRREGS